MPTVPEESMPPVQVALAAKSPMPVPPTLGVTATGKAPTAPATPNTVDLVRDVTDHAAEDHKVETPTPIDTEAEDQLSAEIVELWAVEKNGKATARRTRAELKALRQQLGEKLHAMKAILAQTGRGGGWASYLRSQGLPVASADRRVAEHEATLTPAAKKVLTEELSEPTVDQVRRAAKKLLPRLTRLLVTQELVYEFVLELLWNMDVAEVTDTDDGLEIPRTSQESSDEVEDQAAELAIPAPAVP
jgi:hypothetical protein